MKLFQIYILSIQPISKQLMMQNIHFRQTLRLLQCSKQDTNSSCKIFCRIMESTYRLNSIYILSKLLEVYNLINRYMDMNKIILCLFYHLCIYPNPIENCLDHLMKHYNLYFHTKTKYRFQMSILCFIIHYKYPMDSVSEL